MHKHANMLLLMQIVFPEAHWIGTNEENPAEKQLPMPAELQLAVQHENYAFGGAAMQTGELVEFKVWRYLAGNADSEDCVASTSSQVVCFWYGCISLFRKLARFSLTRAACA